jgi:methionyl-tRNA formyltransferase
MEFAAHTAIELKNRWRGFQPWPGAFTALDGKKLIVHRMEVADAPASQESSSAGPAPAKAASADSASILPGQIRIQDHRLLVACAGNTWLELVEVQLEGKKRLAATEFLRGIAFPANARLG